MTPRGLKVVRERAQCEIQCALPRVSVASPWGVLGGAGGPWGTLGSLGSQGQGDLFLHVLLPPKPVRPQGWLGSVASLGQLAIGRGSHHGASCDLGSRQNVAGQRQSGHVYI